MKIFYLILFLTTTIKPKINLLKNNPSNKNKERRLSEFASIDMSDRIKIEGLKQRLDNLIGKVVNLNKTMVIKFETIETFTLSKIEKLRDNFKEYQKEKIERELGMKLDDLHSESNPHEELEEEVINTEEKLKLEKEKHAELKRKQQENIDKIKIEMEERSKVTRDAMEKNLKNLEDKIKKEFEDGKDRFDEQEKLRETEQDKLRVEQELKIKELEALQTKEQKLQMEALNKKIDDVENTIEEQNSLNGSDMKKGGLENSEQIGGLTKKKEDLENVEEELGNRIVDTKKMKKKDKLKKNFNFDFLKDDVKEEKKKVLENNFGHISTGVNKLNEYVRNKQMNGKYFFDKNELKKMIKDEFSSLVKKHGGSLKKNNSLTELQKYI